jgi:phytoene synthase
MKINKEDLKYCRDINKKYGKTYYFATRFFKKAQRDATHVLYAFYRLPDEIVDNETEFSTEKLGNFISDWRSAVEQNKSNNPVLSATLEVHREFYIPFEYSFDFLKSMQMDLTKKRYQDYQELDEYIYGSASCVGLMMSYVVGFNEEKKSIVLQQAHKMGTAMQLTNMLRDINEDYILRDRIYLPLKDWAKFNIKEDQIKNNIVDDNFINFMKFQINRTRELFKEAENEGVKHLNKSGRLPVLLASRIYGEILHEIEKNNYDVFSQRARVSFIKKLFIAFVIIIKYGKEK